jgi:hypothetical protein
MVGFREQKFLPGDGGDRCRVFFSLVMKGEKAAADLGRR